MLQFAMPLVRTPDTTPRLFRTQETLYYDTIPMRLHPRRDGRGHRFAIGSVTLGSTLARPDGGPLDAPLVKLYEHYTNLRTATPVFVERLCYHDTEADALYPYKIRYRTEDGPMAYVSCNNLGRVHGLLTGRAPDEWAFNDPRIAMVGAALESPIDDDLASVLFSMSVAFTATPGLDLDRFSPDAYTLASTADLLDALARVVLRYPAPDFWDDERMMRFVREWFAPQFPLVDPLTGLYLNQPIPVKALARRIDRRKHFLPPLHFPLAPADPVRASFSPKAFAAVAEAIERLPIAAFTYDAVPDNQDGATIVPGSLEVYDPYTRFWRGGGAVVTRELDGELRMIAIQALAEGLFNLPVALTRETARVRISKSQNEEALLEFCAGDDPAPRHSVHLDFAFLSLCSMGVALLEYV